MTRLFIYGTLMRGFRNEGMMTGARFIGPARTDEARWRMMAIMDEDYPFPGVTAGESYITGELYEVDDALLARLDAFELEGQDYMREDIVLESSASAQFYRLILPGVYDLPDAHAQIRFDEGQNCYQWINR